jgi:hypothetical protein
MTSVAFCVIGPVFSKWFIPGTIASHAGSILAPICLAWLRQAVIIPNGSSQWRCVWWSRTACPIGLLPGTSGVITASSFHSRPFRTGWKPREKKSITQVDGPYLEDALASFSGYLAADELYDGPFCVLSVVDARQQRRLMYEVLDHNPTRLDILMFFARLNDHLYARGLAVAGITTDASPLYPLPICLVFRDILHQICEFHILKELTAAVLRVLAHLRKRLAEQKPQLPRGRLRRSKKNQALRQQAQAIQQRISSLFEHRHLFVRHQLDNAQRAILRRLVRSDPRLRALRAIMNEVYRLFDRRCRTETALQKLTKLRQRLRRYRSLGKCLDKLNSPNLEKALTFLDDKLLPATSNVVERANRRHRKMQKAVYRVRTKTTLENRLALDLQREQQACGRKITSESLHKSRG